MTGLPAWKRDQTERTGKKNRNRSTRCGRICCEAVQISGFTALKSVFSRRTKRACYKREMNIFVPTRKRINANTRFSLSTGRLWARRTPSGAVMTLMTAMEIKATMET